MQLTKEAQGLLDLNAPLYEKLRYVRRERRIGYADAVQFVARVQNLYQHQYEHRSLCLALTGQQWHGKTTILNLIHDQAQQTAPPRSTPSIRMDVQAAWSLTSLYNSCLKALGAPTSMKGDPSQKFSALQKVLIKKGTTLLIFDEFHDIRRCQPRQMPLLLSGMRALCNIPGITVVLGGLPEVADILNNDQQLSSRFERHNLGTWKESKEYYDFISTLLSDFPLPDDSDLLDPDSDLASQLLQLSKYRLGAFSVIVCEAACLALADSRSGVTVSDIQSAATTFRRRYP